MGLKQGLSLSPTLFLDALEGRERGQGRKGWEESWMHRRGEKVQMGAKHGSTHFSPGPGKSEMEGYKFENFIERLKLSIKTFNPLINRYTSK